MSALAPTNATLRILPKTVVYGELEAGFAPLNQQAWHVEAGEVAAAADGAALLRDVPGAAVVRNGPLTGLIQLRGLSGDRVKVSLDGLTITPACPNHMDPPLHYLAPSAVDSIVVMTGLTPVSQGGDSLAGTVLVSSAPPRFATNESALYFGDTSVSVRTGSDGLGLDGGGGVASQRWSVAYEGARQTAENYRFPGGRVHDTRLDTQQHALRLGAWTRSGTWTADVGLLGTRDAGTPALPMDMIEDDGYRGRLGYSGSVPFGSVEARAYYHAIHHLMDNFSLRPSGAMRMRSPAESDDAGAAVGLTVPRDAHTFRAGVDFHRNAFDAYQENVATGRRQDTLNASTRTRFGAYAEWLARWTPRWQTQLGVRNDDVWSDAGLIAQWFPASAADRDAFNAADHVFTEVNLDAAVTVRFLPNRHSAYELGFARKNRAPSLLERYLWTPLSASAGQADGRTYLGNLDLDSETSHQFAATADWHGTNWQVRLTPFYQRVSDYIQGTPIGRLDTSGRPVLQFQNISEAELYGAEGLAGVDLTRHLSLRGTFSYVRGRNQETDDNLYRIAPLRGTVRFEQRVGVWQSRVEVVLVNRQEDVAGYADEPTTPGYALLNLRAAVRLSRHLDLLFGLENVFDTEYADHLGGVNRVAGSDVAVGERIPGVGRSLWITLTGRY